MNTISDNLSNHMFNKKDCATTGQVERLSLSNMDTTNTNGAQNRDTVEQFGFQELGAISATHKDSSDQARYFAGQSLNGAQNNYTATSTGTKDILVQNAVDTGTIIKSSTDGFTAVALDGKDNTANVISATSDGFSRLAMQSSYQSSESAQRDATNTANVLLGQTIGYKDGIINATVNASAVALQNATLSAQSQANMASGFCTVQKEISYTKASLELLAAQNKASSDLLAMQNKCALELEMAKNNSILLAKMAECCCENEKLVLTQNTLIVEKTNQTNALVLKLDDERTRAELSDVKLKLAICEAKKAG